MIAVMRRPINNAMKGFEVVKRMDSILSFPKFLKAVLIRLMAKKKNSKEILTNIICSR